MEMYGYIANDDVVGGFYYVFLVSDHNEGRLYLKPVFFPPMVSCLIQLIATIFTLFACYSKNVHPQAGYDGGTAFVGVSGIFSLKPNPVSTGLFSSWFFPLKALRFNTDGTFCLQMFGPLNRNFCENGHGRWATHFTAISWSYDICFYI